MSQKIADAEMSNATSDQGLDAPYPVTEEQKKDLYENGWVKLPGFLSKEVAAKLCETLLAIPSRGVLSGPDAPAIDPSKLLMHEGVARSNSYVKRVATSRRVASATVDLMKRPDAIFVQDISFFKPVGAIVTPWHQDLSYWPFDKKGCLTFWIALEDMEPDMGVLSYLEGSHLEGPLGYINLEEDIRDTWPQLKNAKIGGGQALKAGDAQAHWGETVHGAGGNEGARRRSALALRYHRSDVVYTGLAHPHYDKFNLKPGKKFTESADFWRVGPKGLLDA